MLKELGNFNSLDNLKNLFLLNFKLLEDAFGKVSYSYAVKELIFEKVRSCSQSDIVRAFNRLILEHRIAPTGKMIVEAIFDEKRSREIIESKKEKAKIPGSKVLKEKEDSIFSHEEINVLVGNLIKKLEGKISKKEWLKTQEYINETLKANKVVLDSSFEDENFVVIEDEKSGNLFGHRKSLG